MSPARTVAFDVLLRVDEGGYASDLLLAMARPLDARDAGLATEIVFGVLRYRSQLDHLIEVFSGRSASRLDREVRLVLEMGFHQIRHLDRVPRHAAVSESVELVKRARKRSAAGFVNAVLRKVQNEPIPWPAPEIELSQPAWLLERWRRNFGPTAARKIAESFLAPPEMYICTTGLGEQIQDIGSQSIVPLLDLHPGQTFLDLCAAPGNKTAQALDQGVRAVACDRYRARMEPLRRLGCPLVQLDGMRPLPFGTKFDRILVDAPCSGTGTLGRNPEIKWRIQPGDLAAFQARQEDLLRNAMECLAPGGLLVYSTCSLEPEENDEVVRAYHPVRLMRRLPGIDPGDGFFAAVIPSVVGFLSPNG